MIVIAAGAAWAGEKIMGNGSKRKSVPIQSKDPASTNRFLSINPPEK
jgi:hypothetical protein